MNDWKWLDKLPRRQQLIVLLLDNYQDVLNGIREMGNADSDGTPLRLMCKAWNHPSYQQLERLRILMRDRQPQTYWHLAERWLRADTTHVTWCPKCQQSHPAGEGRLMHKHGGELVTLTPRAVKQWSHAVDPAECAAGVRWLASRWRGEPFLPPDLEYLTPNLKEAA